MKLTRQQTYRYWQLKRKINYLLGVEIADYIVRGLTDKEIINKNLKRKIAFIRLNKIKRQKELERDLEEVNNMEFSSNDNTGGLL